MNRRSQGSTFKRKVWVHYKKHGRKLPWRPPAQMLRRTSPLSNGWAYKILISEIMLQQTQVDRVIPKFDAFIKKFPSFKALANAATGDVLRAWQGLGYNRRALALKRAAELIVKNYKGTLPSSEKELIALPGIGDYTAGALRAFVFNEPSVIIETNIRTAYIHHFEKDLLRVSASHPRLPAGQAGSSATEGIRDKDMLKLIERDIRSIVREKGSPRCWYWALMDYGSYLKKEFGNANRKSKHYTKQSKFEGSRRQIRGAVLRALLQKPKTVSALTKETEKKKEDIISVLADLKKEGFVGQKGQTFSLV